MIAQPQAFRLLETGVAVPFRVVKEEVLPGADESEFGMRVTLQLEDPEELGLADFVDGLT